MRQRGVKWGKIHAKAFIEVVIEVSPNLGGIKKAEKRGLVAGWRGEIRSDRWYWAY